MKISLACDHGGLALKEQIKKHLLERGFECCDFGTNSLDSCDYPVFAHPYNYYQTHLPDIGTSLVIGEDSIDNSSSDGARTLRNISVKAKRRTRRALDYSKPAYVADAYDIYNEATDRGLSWGVINMGAFPPTACQTVYGNMNRYRSYNVVGKLDRYTFYTNFIPMQDIIKNRSDAALFKDLHLNRVDSIRFYTDFEPRNYTDRHTEQLNLEDVVVVYVPVADDGKRFTYRDRRIMLEGFTYPEEHYSPDYSTQKPAEPTDYRSARRVGKISRSHAPLAQRHHHRGPRHRPRQAQGTP